jgi:hypothetical protein
MTTEDTRIMKKSQQELALEAKHRDEDEHEDSVNDLDTEQERLTEIEELEEQSPAVLV